MRIFQRGKKKCLFLVIIIMPLVWLIAFCYRYTVVNHKVVVEENKDFLLVMKSRFEHVRSTCSHTSSVSKAYKLSAAVTASHSYWCSNMHLIYCPTFKSASSTWIENLIHICGKNESIVGRAKQRHRGNLIEQLKYVGAIEPPENLWSNYTGSQRSENITTFMVVRHPFERLVSAYRDKLERMDMYYYETYGKKIVYRFRERAWRTLGADFFSPSNNYGTLLKISTADRPNANLPSFWEFAQSVIIGLNMDEHWIPIYKYCSVCNLNQFSNNPYILKFESLDVEESAFVEYMGWEDIVNKTNKLNVNKFGDMSSEEITQLYFSVLSQEDIMKLFHVYKNDFLLFQYKFKIGNLTLPLMQD